jgi:hypothetical protein
MAMNKVNKCGTSPMIVKPSRPAYYGEIINRLSFDEAYAEVSRYPKKVGCSHS